MFEKLLKIFIHFYSQNTLENRFKQGRYLGIGERTKLAQKLELSETQVGEGVDWLRSQSWHLDKNLVPEQTHQMVRSKKKNTKNN